jgi:hypothetical protein
MTTAANIPKWTASGDFLDVCKCSVPALASMHKHRPMTTATVFWLIISKKVVTEENPICNEV